MPLPHFNNANMKSYQDPIYNSQFEARIYTSLGEEIKNLHIESININEGRNTTLIECNISSTIKAIADFKTLSNVKYIHFGIYDRKGYPLKSVIHNVSLTGVQGKFDYSLDTSIQTNDCSFIAIKSHDIELDGISTDDAIKKIIRGEKIDNILD